MPAPLSVSISPDFTADFLKSPEGGPMTQTPVQTPSKIRVILELGSGNDLHGSDYTKAALRAVQDALHHSSLSFIRSLKIDRSKVDVDVTIGVQKPEKIDIEKVRASLPVGNVTVKAVKGGLDVADPEGNDPVVIASAAIAVRIDVRDIGGSDQRSS
jgi:uncharacterized protein (TIGR02058 family)